ncbi:MAG: histone deacetylase [Anaerolineae bacterium]|nr:histone deacetylase [Anaerolineae bacterium]
MTTGYVYDPVFLAHTKRGHPESAERLSAIMSELEDSDLKEMLVHVPSRAAEPEELALIHDITYIAQVKSLSQAGGGYLDMDTYVTPYTYEAAAKAAGSTVDLTLTVLDGKLDNGFALVRPPGHHALRFQGMGFCVFNNIVLAARVAQQQRDIERVAIVDFDVHHGNGTQPMTEEDPTILFISTHQYPFYPGTGGLHEIGKGAGEGYTVNLPLRVGVDDAGFVDLYREIVIPSLQRFKPDLMLVSAGYDAHWDDPLAGLALSLAGYAAISKMLVMAAETLCQGRIIFVLEGGYNLPVLRVGVANTFRALLNRNDFADPVGPSPYTPADLTEYIAEAKHIHDLNPK